MEGPYAPYQFNFYINASTGYEAGAVGDKFKIQLEFLSSLAGSNQETLLVTFTNPSIMVDSDGNKLQTEEMTKQVPFMLVVISEEEKAAAAAQSSAGIITMILTLATSTLVSILLGGTIEATWLLFGCIQLMSFVPLFNLNLPANFREFAKNLAVMHGEPAGMPNLFEGFFETSKLEPYNEYFDLMNFSTERFLLNSGRKVQIWALMFSGMGITFILFDFFSEITGLGKLVRKIDVKVRYGLLVRSVTQFYLSFALSAILDAYTLSWSGEDLSVFGNLVAMIGMAAIIMIPVKSFNIVYRTKDLSSLDFQRRYKTLIAGLKITSPLCYQFNWLFYFRRAVYAALFVLFQSKPTVQIFFANASAVSMLLYVIIVRPYSSHLSTLLSITNEFLLAVLIGSCWRFLDPVMTPSMTKLIGNGFVGIVIGTIAVNWISIVVYSIGQYTKVKARKKKLGLIRSRPEAPTLQYAHLNKSTKSVNMDAI